MDTKRIIDDEEGDRGKKNHNANSKNRKNVHTRINTEE